jgi:hypothetical protein
VRRLRRVIGVSLVGVGSIFVCALVAFAFAISWARHVEHLAEGCLANFVKLEVGKSTFADLVIMQQRYGGTVFTTEWPDCTPQHCAYQFNFQNTWLYRLHLAPHVRFGLTILLENNRITQKEMVYGVDPVDRPGTQATHVTETYTIVSETIPEEMMRGLDPLPCTKDFRISVQLDSRAHPFHYSISMNTNAPPDYRKLAYSVDLQCLERIGECDRGRILAPLYDGAPCLKGLLPDISQPEFH